MAKLLVIGANGQLGTVLAHRLKEIHGTGEVIASDIRDIGRHTGFFEVIDATDAGRLGEVIRHYGAREVYHLAAILSANGEKDPLRTWDVNMRTIFNVLEVSRKAGVEKVFFPSSIAVFGDGADRQDTPQASFLNPDTVYGISKASGEAWAQYYFRRYGLDVRSLRYPGVIGHQSLPGGGTTDYAVEIYHKAVRGEGFSCFLEKGTTLPMIYMDDAIRATVELMQAPAENIKARTSYNLAGMSFSPEEIAASVAKVYPGFKISYDPDFRQEIAATWPKSIDDSRAREDWGWRPAYDLDSMTVDMVKNLKIKGVPTKDRPS